MTGFASEPRGTLSLGRSSEPADFRRRLAGVPARIFDLILTWQERSETRARLASLDDHLLKDIGLSRAAAQHEADKPFWRL